jgi:pyrroline-5-carboxylate reductase
MRIGFIGIGKISSSVVESICTSGLNNYEIFLSPRNQDKSKELAAQFERVSRADSNQEVLDRSDIVFIALRPPIYKDVISDLYFREDHIVVSLIPFSFYSDILKLITPAKNLSRATPLPTVITHTCPIPVYKPNPTVWRILQHIGQPFEIPTEEELHTIWTLTCLISPYYDLLDSLTRWAADNYVEKEVASKYIADMFHTLSNAAHLQEKPDFNELSQHAATPGGLNERTAKEIEKSGAHEAYVNAAQTIRALFKR